MYTVGSDMTPGVFHAFRRQAPAFVFLLLSLTIPGCKKPAPPQHGPPNVTVATPLKERITDWNEYTGRLAAVDSVEIRPRVSGYVDSVHFTEGQSVGAGDLLYTVDKRPYLAEYGRAKARLAQANAALGLAKANAQRAKTLLETRAISKEEADIRASEELSAQANVEQAHAELEAARLQLEFTEVRSPIAGIAGRFLITRGNLVQGGQGEGTLLTTVVSHDPIYAYFEADEASVLNAIRRYFAGKQVGRGEPGDRPIEMQLADETGFPHKGQIDFIDNQLDSGTATIEFRGRFENDDRFFTPGMFVRVRVPAGREEDCLLVPESAIVADLTARFLWVLEAGNTVNRRQVKLGSRQGALRIIQSGLNPEDKVVINGIQALIPGSKVNPQPGTIPPLPKAKSKEAPPVESGPSAQPGA